MKAQEARKIAEDINTTDHDFESLTKRIVEAASKGEFSIKTYGIRYKEETLSTLRDLGFKVEVDEYTDTTISW